MRSNRFFLRIGVVLLVFIFMIVFGLVFKISILRGVGKILIKTDELRRVEVIFVLGGNSFDRGNEAAKLYKEGFAERIVCLGENVYPSLKALNVNRSESEITQFNIVQNRGVDSVVVESLRKGTSTKEEAEAILKYCQVHDVKSAMVVSDKFHTRRIQGVFRPLFEDATTELIIHGSPSSQYKEGTWWEKEEGLIMVNNEYVKLLYYWLRY